MDIANKKLEIIKLIGDLQSERLVNWLLKILRQKPTESAPLLP